MGGEGKELDRADDAPQALLLKQRRIDQAVMSEKNTKASDEPIVLGREKTQQI